MKTSTIVAVLVAIVVIGGGWYWYSMQAPAATPSTNTTINTNPNGADYTPPATDTTSNNSTVGADVNAGVTVGSVPTKATVAYTVSGFSPKSVTIQKGGTITFTNQGSGQMWIASAPHPAHTGYDGTSRTQHCVAGYTGATPFDECAAGNTYSFTFTKAGSFNYHNHLGSEDFGTITVVE